MWTLIHLRFLLQILQAKTFVFSLVKRFWATFLSCEVFFQTAHRSESLFHVTSGHLCEMCTFEDRAEHKWFLILRLSRKRKRRKRKTCHDAARQHQSPQVAHVAIKGQMYLKSIFWQELAPLKAIAAYGYMEATSFLYSLFRLKK